LRTQASTIRQKTPQSGREAASIHHKLMKCDRQLPALMAFTGELQMQEQIPADNESNSNVQIVTMWSSWQ